MKKTDRNKRRKLLALGLVAGAGALTGAGINSVVSGNKQETIKMLTASGELVEVDIRHIPQNPREKPVSNAELKNWMDKGENKNT